MLFAIYSTLYNIHTYSHKNNVHLWQSLYVASHHTYTEILNIYTMQCRDQNAHNTLNWKLVNLCVNSNYINLFEQMKVYVFFCRYTKNKLVCIVCICVVKRFFRATISLPILCIYGTRVSCCCCAIHCNYTQLYTWAWPNEKKNWICYRISIEFKTLLLLCTHCFSEADNLLQAVGWLRMRVRDHDGSVFDRIIQSVITKTVDNEELISVIVIDLSWQI